MCEADYRDPEYFCVIFLFSSVEPVKNQIKPHAEFFKTFLFTLSLKITTTSYYYKYTLLPKHIIIICTIVVSSEYIV